MVYHKWVCWLPHQMGLEAIDHKPWLTRHTKAQAIDPYFLRGFTLEWMSQVWSADITSIRACMQDTCIW
jgi:hypothetical protein